MIELCTVEQEGGVWAVRLCDASRQLISQQLQVQSGRAELLWAMALQEGARLLASAGWCCGPLPALGVAHPSPVRPTIPPLSRFHRRMML